MNIIDAFNIALPLREETLERDKLDINEKKLEDGEYYNEFSQALRNVLKKRAGKD